MERRKNAEEEKGVESRLSPGTFDIFTPHSTKVWRPTHGPTVRQQTYEGTASVSCSRRCQPVPVSHRTSPKREKANITEQGHDSIEISTT